MPIDWTLLIEKKQKLGRVPPSVEELRSMERTIVDLLKIPAANVQTTWARSLGYGFRTLAVVQVYAESGHRHTSRSEAVVVKLYRGSVASQMRFHQTCISRLPVVPGNDSFQQTLEAGTLGNGRAYAVLQYVEGQTLREFLQQFGDHQDRRLVPTRARALLTQLIGAIWIPSWDAGLRFKDCHPGNMVISPADRLTMIDVEQLRKSAFELLDQPGVWSQRAKHEKIQFSKLPGLIREVMLAIRTSETGAALERRVRHGLAASSLLPRLAALGRNENPDRRAADRKAASDALQSLLDQLIPATTNGTRPKATSTETRP